ncbi:MAG: A/G-specific adenine glycosylase [Pseudomonadota bacterium]
MAETRADPTGLAAAVVRWQRSHGRPTLPWQNTRDPYRVWLSEIMLQQTQVSTVLGYYERFLQRCPTVTALADTPLDDVLTLWSGLGYYSRARNLHRAAQTVRDAHGGVFPASAAALAELPGIGRSTAAAIAAFCFGERVAILDGNVKRVLSRALAFGDDLASTRAERVLWQHATDLLPTDPADMPAYTQGLMDLGATVCAVREPNCLLCPLQAGLCAARAAGTMRDYPVKTRKLVRKARSSCWLWLEAEGAIWLEQRPATGVWAGLWTLPLFDTAAELLAALPAWGLDGEPVFLPAIDHALTHLDWRLQPCQLRLAQQPGLARDGRWVPGSDLSDIARPAPLRKLLAGV